MYFISMPTDLSSMPWNNSSAHSFNSDKGRRTHLCTTNPQTTSTISTPFHTLPTTMPPSLSIISSPFKPSRLSTPPSPFSPRSPLTPCPLPKDLSHTHTPSTASRPTQPTPASPLYWQWTCHSCRLAYPLGATRRCLEDGHMFCAGETMVRKRRGEGARSKMVRKRSRACGSAFDYAGWKGWGRWRRRASVSGSTSINSGINTSAGAGLTRSAGIAGPAARKKNCWQTCDYPSNCRWGTSVGVVSPPPTQTTFCSDVLPLETSSLGNSMLNTPTSTLNTPTLATQTLNPPTPAPTLDLPTLTPDSPSSNPTRHSPQTSLPIHTLAARARRRKSHAHVHTPHALHACGSPTPTTPAWTAASVDIEMQDTTPETLGIAPALLALDLALDRAPRGVMFASLDMLASATAGVRG
ncbi:hypothetical protein C7974DRAFT_8341 [Boeremia exigua]|uniref:uncharacterized protein n=1 Tax=Boeremia exigua TaxID=749465 RepID=UPI001E8D4C24|nr:uncharacterized protein C7974DRAFT_8341 [Boeremia exigua]KAH6643869.1 hypothetical protein C7974DRAFT_8341 [Boeremia exigua]